MAEKKFKQVCHCEKCGNEAEMMVTCEFVPEDREPETQKNNVRLSETRTEKSEPAHTVCTHCGAEADMWIDFTGK